MQLHPKTFRFLSHLRKNNNREWFELHRAEYEEIKSSFEDFVGALIASMSQKDSRLVGLEAKHCVYRIYRDVRFSNDKTPYKKHLSAGIGQGGRKSQLPSLYVHIEPKGETWIGGGMWRPEPPLLKKVRQEIDYNWDAFQKVTKAKGFKSMFGEPYEDRMTLVPKGYDKENPAADMLKYKSFVYGRSFDDAAVLKPEFFKEAVKTYAALKPFFDFLYQAAED